MRRFGPDHHIPPRDPKRDPVVFGTADYRIVWRQFPNCDIPDIDGKDHRAFDLRFYLPHRALFARRGRIQRLMVLINGLDEFQNFKLYDDVGTYLAARGIACVLLPLPDHLNRHWKFRLCEPDKIPAEPTTDDEKKLERPSNLLRKDPALLFDRYLQLLEELEILRRHVAHECHASGSCDARDFFRTWFAPGATISLLGYSLGGLAALSALLLDPTLYRSVVLLCSGVSLDRIVLPAKMFTKDREQDEWQDAVISPLKRAVVEGRLKRRRPVRGLFSRKTRSEAHAVFSEVLLGTDRNRLRAALKHRDRKVLFLSGGADGVMNPRDVADWAAEAHGLLTMTIPGVDHFLAISPQWTRWLELACAVIREFEEHAASDAWDEDACRFELAELNVAVRDGVIDDDGPHPERLRTPERVQRWNDAWEVALGMTAPSRGAEDWVLEESLMILLQQGLGTNPLAEKIKRRLGFDESDLQGRVASFRQRRSRAAASRN